MQDEYGRAGALAGVFLIHSWL